MTGPLPDPQARARVAALPPAAVACTGPAMPRYARPFLAWGRELRFGRLTLGLPGGQQIVFTGSQPGPDAAMTVARPRLARRVLLGGHLGFAEAFLDGDWDSPDLTRLLLYMVANEHCIDMEPRWYLRLAQHVVHRLHRNSRSGSRRNIAAHYDLGNEFYQRWLDRSMTYSAGLFDGSGDLEPAQHNKYQRIAGLIGLAPGQRILEIGCGWGGFAQYAAERGARVVGLTLSQEQLAYASRRLQSAGLNDQAEIRLQDYRDVQGRFDAVVSIEMIEAVGEAYWPTYFGKIRDVLKPGGVAALQAILIEDWRFEGYRRSADFIQRYVFPGGMLPAPGVLWEQTKRAGLRWLQDDSFRHDYARTLRLWHERFLAAWPEISGIGFDDRFRRLWSYYLCYCEAGFTSGSIDLRQIALLRE